MRALRPLVAEFLGTFLLVFAGTAALVADQFPNGKGGPLATALAYGLALGIATVWTLPYSGGLLNPAITVGFMSTGRLKLVEGLKYIGAQLLGGVAGALVTRFIWPANVGRPLSFGTPTIISTLTMGQAILIEGVLAFVLTSALMGAVVSARAATPKLAGLWMGLTLTLCVLLGGPMTGAAVNPARAFGPAVVSGLWIGHMAYWIGPILGAVAAAFLWEKVLLEKE